MKQFLSETWQIWYWAYFQPSRLQAWISKVANNDDGLVSRLIGVFAKPAFSTRFALLALLLLSPLITMVAKQGQPLDWLIVLTALLCIYGLTLFPLAISLTTPWLFLLVYSLNPYPFRQGLEVAGEMLPPWPQLALGIGVYTLGLVATSLLGSWFWREKRIGSGRLVLVIGLTSSVALGAWLTTYLWWFTLVLVLLAGIFSFRFVRNEPHRDEPAQSFVVAGGVALIVAGGVAFIVAGGVAFIVAGGVALIVAGGVALIVAGGVAFIVAGVVAGVVADGVAFGVAGVVAGGVAGGVAGVVAFVVAGGVAALATLPLPWLALAGWLLGMALAVWRWRWAGVGLGVVLFTLGFSMHGLAAAWVALAALFGYYRVLPFYLGQALLSGLTGQIQANQRGVLPRLDINSVALLRRLPPYSSELLWVPLPCHDRLLSAAFAAEPDAALEALDLMRASSYHGFRPTVERAIPQMVAEHLTNLSDLAAVQAITNIDYQQLARVVPQFYQVNEAGERISVAAVRGDALGTAFVRLLQIARSITVALAHEQGLVERGLETQRDELRKLRDYLLTEGLNQHQAEPWIAVAAHWAKLLDAELAVQRRLNQGELANPFYTGNPLRIDQHVIFRGRRELSSDLLRAIYDQSRPTVLLYGPRRFGKTSFLRNLPKLLPAEVVPIFYSMQDQAALGSVDDFCYGLVRAMIQDGALQGLKLPATQRSDFLRNPYAALQDWIDTALPRLGSRRLLICLDEVEKLGVALTAGKLELSIFDHLRELIQHSDLAFLFCGSVQHFSELGPNWSSYFISVRPLEIGYLAPADAQSLLTEPRRGEPFDLSYASGVVDQIIELTRCQPYLVQLIGHALVNAANQRKVRLVCTAMLEETLSQALRDGAPYFNDLWREQLGRIPTEVAAGQAILRALAHGQPLPALEAAAAQAALRRMQRFRIIEAQGAGYAIEVPLVARWVREFSEGAG